MKNKLTYLLGLFILFISCTSDDEVVDPPKEEVKKETLVNYQAIKEITSAEMTAHFKNLMAGTPESLIPPITLGGVTVYKLTYKTSYPGKSEKILASGALIVPNDIKNSPILSYQHGTIIENKDAPSLFSDTKQNNFAAVFSATGFYVSMPDYLGYGESSNELHLYEHGESLATASYDMLLAAREFLFINKHNVGDKLFLTGYSEGGYATMALHQHIEAKGKLTVTASAPAAGAYNKSLFAQEVVSKNEPLPFIKNYLWVIDSYNRAHGINKLWSHYLNEPFASKINPTNPLSVFSTDIDTNPTKLFTQEFRDEISSKENTEFNKALQSNNRYDWKANAPVRLYYGTKDDFVYPSNSISAHDAMKSKGSNVSLVAFEGKDHLTAIDSYGAAVLTWFFTLK